MKNFRVQPIRDLLFLTGLAMIAVSFYTRTFNPLEAAIFFVIAAEAYAED